MRLGYYRSTGANPITYNVWKFDPENPEPFLITVPNGDGSIETRTPDHYSDPVHDGGLVWRIVEQGNEIGRYYVSEAKLLAPPTFTFVSDEQYAMEEQGSIVCLVTKAELETLHKLRAGTHETYRVGT